MKKKNLIRILIMVVIVGIICFFDCSFAEEVVKNDPLKKTAFSLNTLVNILAWFWVYLANLAGTFLTNNWIYAEGLKLDVLLRKFWNVIKNMANFCLGFYFLYTVFRGLFQKDVIMKQLKSSLLWVLVAGVGIQASWFLTAVVIDVSSITLAAVGSLPSQVISENKDLESALKTTFGGSDTLSKGIEVSLFSKDARASSFIDVHERNLETPITFESFLDSIMPNADNVAGPLYFMGYSILNTISVVSINDSSPEGIKSTIITTIMQGGTTIIFGIEMAVLCIIALVRVVYLWMFIVFSPFAVLLWCLKKSGEKGGDFVKTFEKYIGLKTFFWNVFKPTIIVLGLGVATIFVSLMTDVVKKNTGRNFDLGGAVAVSVSNGQSNLNGNEGDKTYTTSLYSKTLDIDFKNAGKTLLEFILSIITVLIVYYIIKISITVGGGSDFVSKTAEKLQNGVGDFITKTPIVPVTAYDDKGVKYTGSISWDGLKKVQGKLNEKYGYQRFEKKTSDQIDSVMDIWGFGDKGNNLTETHKTELQRKFKSGIDDVRRYINDKNSGIKTQSGRGMILDSTVTGADKTWIEEFGKWLDEKSKLPSYTGPLQRVVDGWKKMSDENKKSRNFAELFKDKKYVEDYRDYFGLDDTIQEWTDLRKADVSKISTSS